MGAISNFHDFTKMIFVYGNICDGFGNSYPNYPVGFKRQVLMDHTFIRLPNHNENLPFKTVLLMRLEDCLKKYQNFTIVFPEAESKKISVSQLYIYFFLSLCLLQFIYLGIGT